MSDTGTGRVPKKHVNPGAWYETNDADLSILLPTKEPGVCGYSRRRLSSGVDIDLGVVLLLLPLFVVIGGLALVTVLRAGRPRKAERDQLAYLASLLQLAPQPDGTFAGTLEGRTLVLRHEVSLSGKGLYSRTTHTLSVETAIAPFGVELLSRRFLRPRGARECELAVLRAAYWLKSGSDRVLESLGPHAHGALANATAPPLDDWGLFVLDGSVILRTGKLWPSGEVLHLAATRAVWAAKLFDSLH